MTGWAATTYRGTVTGVRVAFVVVIVGAAGASGDARAAESAEAEVERLAAEAVNAYKGADYKRAVELLQKAYEIRQVPALLYNWPRRTTSSATSTMRTTPIGCTPIRRRPIRS